MKHSAGFILALFLFAPTTHAIAASDGSEDPRTAIQLERTAVFYFESGNAVLAQPLFERALRIREQTLGPEGLALAGTLLHLGEVYRSLGKDDLARAAFQRAWDIRAKVWGADHPAVVAIQQELDALAEAKTYADAAP
ncbi:tetratricopeptide repeat protein [Candidatus Nitrospira bockiana]